MGRPYRPLPVLSLLLWHAVCALVLTASAAADAPRAYALSGSCTLSAPDLGLSYDLATASAMAIADSHEPPWTYLTSVCAPLAPSVDKRAPASCEATRGADNAELVGAAYVFQFESGGACHRISGADPGAGATMVPDAERFGLQFGFAGGDACPAPGGGFVHRLANVTLECYNGRVSHGTVEETGLCKYRIAIRHPAACPLECPRGAAGGICSGRSHGACVKDPATARPLCRCAGGFSGLACEVSPAAPLTQPSAEPSPPPPPLSRALPVKGLTRVVQKAGPVLDSAAVTPLRTTDVTHFWSAVPASPMLAYASMILITVVASSRVLLRRPITSRATFAACAVVLFSLAFFSQYNPAACSSRAPSHFRSSFLAASSALTQPQVLPSLASRLLPLSDFNRNYQRIFVRTFNIACGGCQCLASFAWGFSQVIGMRGAHITTRTPVWDSLFTGNISLVGEGTARGDIVINHEYYTSQPHPDSGIKQFIMELGDIPAQAVHSASKFLGHGFYTRDFLRAPSPAMLRIFVHSGKWPNVPGGPEELRGVKENLVLVDDEGPNGVLGMLRQRLSARWPDLAVVELKGFTSEELVGLFRRAKVYVDGGMRGLERTAQEAMLYYVVPVLEFGRNGQNEFDYPLPSSLKYDLSRNEKDGNIVQNRMEEVEAKVEAVLGDWWGGKYNSLQRIDINHRLLASHPRLAAIDMARLIAATLHVHVLACSPFAAPPQDSAPGVASAQSQSPHHVTLSAYLVATALHYVAQAASATLHTALEDGELEADAAELLLAARSTAGTLAFTRVAASSPLCAASDGPSAPGETEWLGTLAHAHFGNSDVAAALSWRALPLQPSAITLWQDALRSSSAPYSTLVLRGVLLGVLFKLDGATSSASSVRPPRIRVLLDAAGAMVLSGPGVIEHPLVWSDDGQGPDASETSGGPPLPRGLWADLRRISAYGVSRVSGMDADPPALDQVIALHESGVDWDDTVTAANARGHAAAARLFRARDRHGGAYLCGHVDFRRVAGFTPHATDLCGGDAVVSIL